MFSRIQLTIGRKIYAVIALGFVGLLGIAFLDSRELASSLYDQKQIELKHIVELGLGVIKDEYAAVQRGELSTAEAQKRAGVRLAALRYGNNEYFWINDMHPRVIMHAIKPDQVGKDVSGNKDANGKFIYGMILDVVRRDGQGYVAYDQFKPGYKDPQPKLSYVMSFAPWGWVVGTGLYIDDLAAQTWSSTQRSLMAAGIVMLIMLAVSVIMARRITTPLRNMTTAMKELASGNLQVAVPGIGRRDEVGEMASAVEVFKTNAEARHALEAEQKQTAARAAEQRKADMHKLADEFQAAVGGIIETVSSAATELEATATTLTETAGTTQQMTATVSAASEEASTNVQAVAAATNEMTSSIGEISRQVQASSHIAEEAVRQAEKTDARVGELSQAANRIGDVVKLITAIAEQTNLLALNATIEAARAGEAGKGFAVVAQEVKQLAAQTGKATGDIASQISSMQAATQDSVAAIKEIGGTIGKIAEIASTIAAAVEEQGAATSEISRNIQHAATGTAQVTANIASVRHGAEETGSASSQVLASAGQLAGESNRLHAEVEKFLSTVRAA